MATLTGVSPVLLVAGTFYDAPHAFREFGVHDPDGRDIAFGQPLGD